MGGNWEGLLESCAPHLRSDSGGVVVVVVVAAACLAVSPRSVALGRRKGLAERTRYFSHDSLYTCVCV